MRVWLICLVLFFAIAELYQWLHALTLSSPVFIAAGILLAVVSNRSGGLRLQRATASSPLHSSSPSGAESLKAAAAPSSQPSAAQGAALSPAAAQLPNLDVAPLPSAPAPISFTIRKPDPAADS